MRFEQIIAAVTRALNIAGIREMLVADSFGFATDLPRYRQDHDCCSHQSRAAVMHLACVSPGMGSYLATQSMLANGQQSLGPANTNAQTWLTVYASPAMGKRKRLPLAKRLLGLAIGGSVSLKSSDG